MGKEAMSQTAQLDQILRDLTEYWQHGWFIFRK
jgi:hypothetical protein